MVYRRINREIRYSTNKIFDYYIYCFNFAENCSFSEFY